MAYLKKSQQATGSWGTPNKHPVGYAALPGLALLESGVPVTDPRIQQAASFVRRKAVQNQQTYELALSILFLARVGNPRAEQLIQTLALRLVVS